MQGAARFLKESVCSLLQQNTISCFWFDAAIQSNWRLQKMKFCQPVNESKQSCKWYPEMSGANYRLVHGKGSFWEKSGVYNGRRRTNLRSGTPILFPWLKSRAESIRVFADFGLKRSSYCSDSKPKECDCKISSRRSILILRSTRHVQCDIKWINDDITYSAWFQIICNIFISHSTCVDEESRTVTGSSLFKWVYI